VRLFTPWLPVNAPEASWMRCTMHGRWFLNAGHSMPEASRVGSNSQVIEEFEKVWLVEIPRKQLLVSSKRLRTSFQYLASCAPLCWLLTCHLYLTFAQWIRQAIKFIENELNFAQRSFSIHIANNSRSYC
jgi:hypothetical protein